MNQIIIANLQVLLKETQRSNDPNDRFRVRAYQNAIKTISGCNYPIRSGAEAQKLDGIGKKIADKIQEILDTGELTQVRRLGPDKLETTKILTRFQKIWGVGPVKAQELLDAGARSIPDIRKKHQDLLTDNQKVGLKYFTDLQKRGSREQVAEVAELIEEEIQNIAQKYNLTVKSRVCGSFRRRLETCGDMDILLCGGKDLLKILIDRLVKRKIIIETLGLGPTKYLGITRLSSGMAFRIDMELIKEYEWPFALLYFTGSGAFNEHQRQIAKKMGYSLSEHGLKDIETGEFIQGIKQEKDIFEFLDMDYLPPWERKV